jgi:hypothetical protein
MRACRVTASTYRTEGYMPAAALPAIGDALLGVFAEPAIQMAEPIANECHATTMKQEARRQALELAAAALRAQLVVVEQQLRGAA